MSNHNRGLWGYTGTALADSEPLTIQSTGMGGPSAAIVLEVREVLGADGTSRALGAPERQRLDPGLTGSLVRAGAREAVVATTDLFYDREPARQDRWAAGGVDAVEMECAGLAAVAARRGVRFGCLLAVSDLIAGERERIGPDELDAAGLALGELAVRALTS
jgi:purine-nucleoside phosphorylase